MKLNTLLISLLSFALFATATFIQAEEAKESDYYTITPITARARPSAPSPPLAQ